MPHICHIEWGERSWRTLRTAVEGSNIRRIPMYIKPCDGKCDDELGRVLEPFQSTVYECKDCYLPRDREDLENFLRNRISKRRFIYMPMEDPSKNLFLPEGIADLVREIENENNKGIEENRPELTLQAYDLTAEADRRRREQEAIEKMRRRGRGAKASKIDYSKRKKPNQP